MVVTSNSSTVVASAVNTLIVSATVQNGVNTSQGMVNKGTGTNVPIVGNALEGFIVQYSPFVDV